MSEVQEEIPVDTTTTPQQLSSPLQQSTSPDQESNNTAQPTSQIKPAEPTRPSCLPKPSGLKPPTKIGRLCSNSAPKPAVPISPRTDGSSSDTLRKLSDDSSRKHLSDLIEADEDGVSSYLPDRPRVNRKASTSSTYSITSMEALWERHPRRLSEAGLRRSSDHSVVLTEDTDSFIIGERVWVGGTKPGQIAYIGETQFAPGDWAGIVLDEPIGKNDGSVAGVRYFQCSEKRGVFSRLTRLTRTPLISHATHDASPVSDASSVFERPPSGAARPRRTLSPNGSVRSVVSSKMNASVVTTTSGELRIGDRVIVSSSRGSKAGTLKYVGVTDFAPGVWGGVELDDPLGKNDGSVDGKRYFECAPRFGLFAPIAKVSRSPSNRKPGACAIHSNGRATPMRRSNSRDSLTSLGTSIASSRPAVRLGVTSLGAQRGPRASSTPLSAKNALQELLREKQHHLERLMRERELERAEVAKASLQADRAESALSQVKKEAEQTNVENAKLKSELDKLNKLLEDEKQKVEDLMFRSEEDNINREDFNKYKETMENEKTAREQRIRELEAEAVLQAERANTTAAALRAIEEQRVSDMNAISEQHKEELTLAQTYTAELQKLLNEAYALLKEKESEKDSLGKSMSEELAKVKVEYEKALNEAKTKITISQTEFEAQLSVLTAKLQMAESKLETEKQNVEKLNKENSQTILDLNTKVTQLQAAVDDKTHELNKVMGSSKEHDVNLNKEITKLKMELSAKILDLEQEQESSKKQETACKNLQDEITKVKEDYSIKMNEYESLLNEVSQENENNKAEILQLQQSLTAKIKDYEKLLTEKSSASDSTDKLINEYKETIHERDKEIIKLKDDFEQATANFNINHSKIAEEHKKEIENRNTRIEQLLQEIESHKQTLDQSKIEFETLNSQYIVNVDELKALKEENEKLKLSISELTHMNSELKAKISAMELEIGELKRQYDSTTEKCNELEKAKNKIENEYMNLNGQATDSNEQFNKLSQHLKDTEKELQELKDKYRESANNHGRTEQELKQKIFKSQEDFSLERTQLTHTANENIEKLKLSQNKLLEIEAHATGLSNRLNEIETSNDKLVDENSILKSEIEALKAKELEKVSEYDSIRKKFEVDIDKYREEISILKAEGATSEVKLMEKVDQLTEAQNDLNNKLEEARKHEDSLQKIVDDMAAQLNNQKVQYNKEVVQVQSQLSTIKEELTTSKSEENKMKDLLLEKENNIKELTLKLEMIEVDLKSNLEIMTEKDRQLTQINEELNKTSDNKKQLEEKLNCVTLETSSLKQQYEALITNSSAEESILKEQLTQLETLRKEMAVLVQNNNNLAIKYKENSNNLEKLDNDYKDNVKKLKEIENENILLNKTLAEKENMVKSQSQKYETEINKMVILEEEIKKLRQDVIDKDAALSEKESQLTKLNESLQTGNNAVQEIVEKLRAENDALKKQYKEEFDSLNNKEKALLSRISEQEKHLEESKQNKEKLSELQQLLAKSESDIKQLTNINEGQKSNYEDLNKQLQERYDEYKRDSKRVKHELKAKLERYEKELSETKDKLRVETEKHGDLQNKLTEYEGKVLELSNKLELLTVQQSSDVDKDDKLEKLTIELQNTRKSNADMLANNETVVRNLKADLDNKLKDLKQKDEFIAKTQEELKNLKAKVEIAQREKSLLEKELASRPKDNKDKNDNAMGVLGQGDTPISNAAEEKEMVEGQVSFLNSVIVDMQRKNEQLLARLQALEGAHVTTDSNAIFNGRRARVPLPRLFCDICDVFDAHDTEDCPRQEATADDAPPTATPRRPPPPPRPYCDICEVFGHTTENCDEEETF